MGLIPTVTHTETSMWSHGIVLDFKSPAEPLSLKGENCRDFDAGADIFLPPNLQYYHV